MFMAIMVTLRTNHSNFHSLMFYKLGICDLGFFQLQRTWGLLEDYQSLTKFGVWHDFVE